MLLFLYPSSTRMQVCVDGDRRSPFVGGLGVVFGSNEHEKCDMTVERYKVLRGLCGKQYATS
jgi:hypothetical protein